MYLTESAKNLKNKPLFLRHLLLGYFDPQLLLERLVHELSVRKVNGLSIIAHLDLEALHCLHQDIRMLGQIEAFLDEAHAVHDLWVINAKIF